MTPENWVHPTPEFYLAVDLLGEALGDAADAILRDLACSLTALESYNWDGSLPIAPYGIGGDSFIYAFHREYAFTFRRHTERDTAKNPVRVRMYLKLLLRRY